MFILNLTDNNCKYFIIIVIILFTIIYIWNNYSENFIIINYIQDLISNNVNVNFKNINNIKFLNQETSNNLITNKSNEITNIINRLNTLENNIGNADLVTNNYNTILDTAKTFKVKYLGSRFRKVNKTYTSTSGTIFDWINDIPLSHAFKLTADRIDLLAQDNLTNASFGGEKMYIIIGSLVCSGPSIGIDLNQSPYVMNRSYKNITISSSTVNNTIETTFTIPIITVVGCNNVTLDITTGDVRQLTVTNNSHIVISIYEL